MTIQAYKAFDLRLYEEIVLNWLCENNSLCLDWDFVE